MRRLYETQNDLHRETAVAELVADYWGCEAKKLPLQYRLDYLFLSQQRRVWVEVKCRFRYRMGDHPYWILSAAKYEAACSLWATFGFPAIFVYAFADGTLAYIRNEDIDNDIVLHGRTDRGDWQDIEPCVRAYTDKLVVLPITWTLANAA